MGGRVSGYCAAAEPARANERASEVSQRVFNRCQRDRPFTSVLLWFLSSGASSRSARVAFRGSYGGRCRPNPNPPPIGVGIGSKETRTPPRRGPKWWRSREPFQDGIQRGEVGTGYFGRATRRT